LAGGPGSSGSLVSGTRRRNITYQTVRTISSNAGNNSDSNEPARKLAMGINVDLLLRS
jgi:hypothetical protein